MQCNAVHGASDVGPTSALHSHTESSHDSSRCRRGVGVAHLVPLCTHQPHTIDDVGDTLKNSRNMSDAAVANAHRAVRDGARLFLQESRSEVVRDVAPAVAVAVTVHVTVPPQEKFTCVRKFKEKYLCDHSVESEDDVRLHVVCHCGRKFVPFRAHQSETILGKGE